MTFAHGLNRSKIADEFIWNKAAGFMGLSEYSSGFAFLFAIICTVMFSIVGLYLASKVLKKDFNYTFTTLGIAFIPLFIFSSLGHTWESFFVKDYEKIIEGLAQGFTISIDVNSLAKRGDSWLHYFNLFKWIGIVWAFILLYKRMKLVDSSKIRKVFAYIFSSFIIVFLIGITFYKDYILKTYGSNSHMGHSSNKEDFKQKTKNSAFIDGGNKDSVISSYEGFYFSLSDPSASKDSKMADVSHTGGRPSLIASKKVYLAYGDISKKSLYKSSKVETFYFDTTQNHKLIENSNSSYSFNVPNNGYYNLYAIEQSSIEDKSFYKVAKLEYLHGKHGVDDIYTDEIKKDLLQNQTKIDLIRIKSINEKDFFYRLSMGDNLKFKVLFENKPLSNASIKVTLQSGWIKELKTNENGEFSFNLIKDYFPKWSEFNKRFKEEFIISLAYQKDNTNYILTYPSYYYPSSNDYESYAYALILIFFTLFSSGIIVYRFRKNRTSTFKENKYV